MAVPGEGTTALPSDAAARFYPGLWNPGPGVFMAPRANGYVTMLSSAARTATPSVATFDNPDWHGGHFVLNVSVVPGSAPSTVLTIRGVDPLSLATYALGPSGLISAAITATGATVLKLFPALTTSGTVTVNDVLPPQFTATVVHGNANLMTYSLVACLVR